MLRHSVPLETPKKIHARDEHYRLRMADLGLAKGLPYTVRGRDDVTVHQRHFEPARVTVNQHRLVQIRQARP